MTAAYIPVGTQILLPAGTRVTVNGTTVRRHRDAIVTVRRVSRTRTGAPRITWKSNGYMASAILKA